MDTSFDLDINNYNISDLISFLNLPSEYSIDLLEKTVSKMINKIYNTDNSQYSSKYKFDIINFIKSAKDTLALSYNDIQTQNEIKKNKKSENREDYSKISNNNLGEIINPLSIHPALQYSSILSNSITGYNCNEFTSVYIFNTLTRDNYFNTYSTNCTFNLPFKLKNVTSLTLTSLQLPNVFFAFSADRGTNQIYIYEDTTELNGIVRIPDGNYTNSPNVTQGTPTSSIGNALEQAINEQILGLFDSNNYRFSVSVDPVTNFTIISNTTYTFRMELIIDNCPEDKNLCNPYTFPSVNVDGKRINNILTPSMYTSTLGYLLGYRATTYSGCKSYISESPFNGVYSSYLYFVLNDYTGSQQISNTYGVLQNSIIDDNVLGLISLNSSTYSYVYENNSDLIYKRRNYFGPVDISKISIKLLSPLGKVVNLLQNDFSFSLTVTSNYNLKHPETPKVTPIV